MKLQGMVLLLCGLFATAAAAEVYRWKDAQGHVHYGDQPAQGSEKVDLRMLNSDAAPKGDADVAEQRAKKIAECGSKRDQLKGYQSATRIVEKDALGNEKEYSEAERQKLIQITQKQIADNCGDVPAEKPAR